MSVVIPCFDVERFLAQTVESVIAQTLDSWELIIVDDGSTDATADIARRYERVDRRIRLVSRPNGGASAGRNTGFAASDRRSDFLIWLDGDDVLEPTALETMARYLDEHPHVGMVFSDRCHIDELGAPVRADWRLTRIRPGRIWPRRIPAAQAPTPFASLFVQDAVTNLSSSLFRRSAYELTDGYDESLVLFEDWDLVLRLALSSEVHFLPAKLTRYRIRSGSATSDPSRGVAGMARMYGAWERFEVVPAEHHSVVAAAIAFRNGQAQTAQWIGWASSALRRRDLRGALHCYAVATRAVIRHSVSRVGNRGRTVHA